MMIKQLLFLLKKVLGLFKADIDEKSYEYDQVMDKKFAILRDEIKNLILKSILTKEKSKAIDNLERIVLFIQWKRIIFLTL